MYVKINNNNTAIKKVFRIVGRSILALSVLALVICLLLELSPVQQKIKEIALQEIMKKTKSAISIGNLRFLPFNRLQLKEIYAADLKNDTLFYAEKINVNFDLFKLLRKQFVIHSVEINRFDLHVSRDSANAPFNFRFLIDAFASDTIQPADTSKIQLAINRIQLTGGHLRYDVFSDPLQAPGLFDVNHIDVLNLQFGAKVHWDNPDNWSSSIDYLSLNEKSGFALKQLKLQVKNAESRMQIKDFHISLPHTEGEIPEANIDYPGLQPNEILSGAVYSIPFNSSKWYPGDFSCFYPELAGYPETGVCSVEIKGKFPEISIPHFELTCGKRLQLTLSAGIADCNAWQTSAFELNVEKCLLDPELLKLPLHTADLISLTGKAAGSLPDLKLDLTAESKQGNMALSGTGGYGVSQRTAYFDISLESPGYNLRSLLPDSAFGNASFRLTAQGTISALNKIEAKADAEIHQFDYMGYSYQDIVAGAAYANDSVSVDLISKDPHLPLLLRGKAGLSRENPFLRLYAELNGVRPGALNLLPQYPDLELSGNIRADIKGFDPERMTASVGIVNLHWITPSGDFNNSPLTISYIADAGRQKQIDISSPMLNVRGKGNFTYAGMTQSLRQAFPVLFSSGYEAQTTTPTQDNFNFTVGIRHANTIAHLLGTEANIPDSAFFVGKYNKEDEKLDLNITAFCIFTQTDTAQIRLDLSNRQNDLNVRLDVKNKSDLYNLEGNMGATVEFIPNPDKAQPDMNIAMTPGLLTLNDASFQIYPAQIAVKDHYYEISNFALRHSTSEYIKVSGIVSDNPDDSLQISVSRFEIGTLLSVLKNKIPLSGTASGDIALYRLTTNPLMLTRNFTIDNMVFDENPIGNLQLKSAWSSERQGAALQAVWNPPDAPESALSGFYLLKKDSLALTADIQGVRLKWLSGYLPESFYGLEGELGARIKINGEPVNPVVSGMLYLNEATVGVRTLNTRYRMTDSIAIENDRIVFNDCMVYDETMQNVKINGSIGHKHFSALNPKLTLNFNQFLVLNNSGQTDSLFYGFVRASGNLNILLQNKDWVLQGNLSNGKANKFMMNFPETAMEAQRYNWLTFVNKEQNDSIAGAKKQQAIESPAFSFPLKLQITLSIDPNLSIGAIINPDTKDAAIVTGRGILDFSYNMANPSPLLMGNYAIDGGKCTLTLKNITKKTFLVQPGGKLNFQGDPMNTTFDLSAMYSLGTYLTSLDPSFATVMTASKIPVNCVLAASGKLDDMQLKYRIELPNQSDEIQRKLDGLIYSDELKIMQTAYLLAFGSFLPANSNSVNTGSASIWTSLASSSITSQLNNLLSGVLRDNWTIGTDLHSNDSNFSDIDMDVNISTRLFNDRLTVNSTLGYHNNTNQTDNFTGDFNIEYKLSPSGNILLQFYNATNNQYYDKSRSPLTQGAGIVYKKEARTFRQLFRSFRSRKNKQ